eukprot:TRINITY_DN1549_c0_g1_i2.p1 TRINITY_DN1549_c0_g1~~TRINITY_DN1549_c0_g1_i2.p1  ORF type:complete len:403 (+),score=81.96 TRINITY_DN1549_c0_g1_i2:286-1494(+)
MVVWCCIWMGGFFFDVLAFLMVLREDFLTEDLRDEAYHDSPLRLSKMGFNISAPHMYAMCLEKLDIQPGDSVLDIGSGTGHFTVIAAYLTGPTGSSLGVDIHKHIINFSIKNAQKYEDADWGKVEFELRNCFLPDPLNRTFDRIHVGACCPESHLQQLIDLLNPGGILVTPYGDRLIKIKKFDNGEYEEETFSRVRYSDLVLPSEAEIAQAQREIASQKAKVIKVPECSLLSDLSNCINNPEFSDIEFSCEGRTIYAHKFILQLRSEHFRCLFSSGLRESFSGVVDVTDFSYQDFMEVIKFIYTGECDINEDNCSELIRASDYFQLDRLKAQCEYFWYRDISTENAGHLLAFAERYNALQLRNYTLEFIFENINEVVKSESWKEIDQETLTYILVESVSRRK